MKSPRSKSIIKQVFDKLDDHKNSFCPVRHRRGWFKFLKTGQLTFSPVELHSILRKVIDVDRNRPRGEKLFYLRKRYNFTAMPDKRPMRPEEALERFIVVSNDSNFYGQVPIGGGKESIDVGIKEDNKFTFVELKPWRSSNSPLYALIESLKNLIEYRVIIERKIKKIPLHDINLCVLAPQTYFTDYGLLKHTGELEKGNIKPIKQLLIDLASAFDTTISFKALSLSQHTFNKHCARLYDEQGLIGQDIITVKEKDTIDSLNYANWGIILAS